MATKWQVKSGSNNVYTFDPADIRIKEDLNGRAELPDISGLIGSIERYGQLQPVLVRNEGNIPVLVAGFSRWRAIVEINKGRAAEHRMKVSAVVVRCNEIEAFERNWDENRKRNATTELDDAHHFHQMELWGKTTDEIAERFGVTKRYVTDTLTLIQAEPEVQSALKAGKIKSNAARKLAKLSAEQQRKAVGTNGHVDLSAIAPAKVSKPTMRDVKEWLQVRAVKAELPAAVKGLCAELLDYIDGREAV